ncbi:MAG: hypothetical protein QNJ00_12545 [Woeseiaceae bacterium]|nr:hypothetical protein [Woeseiaceae bacterium]
MLDLLIIFYEAVARAFGKNMLALWAIFLVFVLLLLAFLFSIRVG